MPAKRAIRNAPSQPSRGRLILLPWHVGHEGDITFRVAADLARLRVLLVESLDNARNQLRRIARVDPAAKELRAIPETADPAMLEWLVGVLQREDVGMMASGGTPAFVDPGAWIVAALRERNVGIVARPGASCLGAMLASRDRMAYEEGQRVPLRLLLDAPPQPVEGVSRPRAAS